MLLSDQNFYVDYGIGLLKSNGSMHHFLTYLKVRQFTRYTYGSFTVNGSLCKHLNLRHRTVQEHIQSGIARGWFRVATNNPDCYQIVRFDSFANPNNQKKLTTVKLSDELLDQISWKNIADLRAFIQEVANQKYLNYKQYKSNPQTHKEWSHRDHIYNRKTKRRAVKPRNDHKKGGSITPLSCSLASNLSGKSTATCHRYRNRESVKPFIRYFNPKITVTPAMMPGFADVALVWNEDKALALRYIIDPNSSKEQQERITVRVLHGQFIPCKNGIVLRAAGERMGTIPTKGTKVKQKRR